MADVSPWIWRIRVTQAFTPAAGPQGTGERGEIDPLAEIVRNRGPTLATDLADQPCEIGTGWQRQRDLDVGSRR